MSNISNTIDFTLFFYVIDANPNGDPLDGNRPRTDMNGYGEVSAECVKRKIRNRMQDMGYRIFVQSEDRCDDGAASLSSRQNANPKLKAALKSKNSYEKRKVFTEVACEEWMDVRAFGQLFANKASESSSGVSIGIRGPVTIQTGKSIEPVTIISRQISKSVNGEDSEKRGKDTMGLRHTVQFGIYQVNGSISHCLAERTGFTQDDAQTVKEALLTLFDGDASSARPEGSMGVIALIWWDHNASERAASPYVLHHAAELICPDESLDNIELDIKKFDAIEPEVIRLM